ncbi:MAG: hypothetical protein FJZ47_18345, partial [Candidatus Tectomicrobia bacterium]|nr:hypothetical protein [Candidatus Tectomicrobia bacterium]
MRRAHERTLLLGLALLVLASWLSYVAFLALIPACFCLLLSCWCGMRHVRRCLPTATVGWRSHCSYLVAAVAVSWMFAPGVEALCCPGDEQAIRLVGVALAVLVSLYLLPFALIRWANGQRVLRLPTAWGLLGIAWLIPMVLWIQDPTALAGAVGEGRERTVRLLLALGCPVNATTRVGHTPLMLAVLAENPALVRLLLAHGAAPNATDNGGSTALDMAVLRGNITLLELLYAAGARLDTAQALAWAVGQERRPVVDWLLAHHATVPGSGALEAAARYTDAAMVQYLLRHTPQPDRSMGLAESVDRGDLEMARLFLAHGADPEQRFHEGMTPLLRAVVSRMI